MNDHPTILDEHRGMAVQRATEIRWRLAEVAADQTALRQRRTELEQFLTRRAGGDLVGTTSLGQDPRRQKLIASVLDDFRGLSAEPRGRSPAGEPNISGEAGRALDF